MSKNIPFQPADLAGLTRLAEEGVEGVTDLVEAMHLSILRALGGNQPAQTGGRTSGVTGLVYESIRAAG